MVNVFSEDRMLELGFFTVDPSEESVILSDKYTGNEVVVFKLGEWLQFRCEVFAIGEVVGNRTYTALLQTLNRMHDLALGVRVTISDGGDVRVISDVLRSTVDNEVAATIARQVLFISELLLDPIQKICATGADMKDQEIDSLFASPI